MRETLRFAVHQAETVLRVGVALVGRLEHTIFSRFGIILRNALAFGIHQPQIVLGAGVPLIGSHAVPFQRVGIALSDAPALIVHAPQSVLRLGVPLIAKLPQEGQCRRGVALVIGRNGVLQRSSQHGCCKAHRQQHQGGSVTNHGLHGSGHRFIQTFAARRCGRRRLGVCRRAHVGFSVGYQHAQAKPSNPLAMPESIRLGSSGSVRPGKK